MPYLTGIMRINGVHNNPKQCNPKCSRSLIQFPHESPDFVFESELLLLDGLPVLELEILVLQDLSSSLQQVLHALVVVAQVL